MTFPIQDIATRFAAGEAYTQYLAHVEKNRDMIDVVTKLARLTADEEKFFRALRGPINALVVSEDWCPDCALNVPVLMRIAAANSALTVRFVGREANYDLLEFAKKGDRKAIPTFFFFDAQWNEIGHWIERPMRAEMLLDEWALTHRPPTEPDRTHAVWREHRQARSTYYRDELFLKQGLWHETVVELRAILSGEVFSNVTSEAYALA
ncbi:MAG: thioredoxin family protein [Chloroflexota bacterium]